MTDEQKYRGCAWLIGLLLWPVFVLWRAYVTSILWNWFIYPAYGFSAPSLFVLGGIMIVLGMLLPWRTVTASSSPNAYEALATSALLPLFALGFGWLWKALGWGV